MPISPLDKPENLQDEKIKVLKDLFPQVFSDGKLNLEALKEELGDLVDDLPNGEEHYGLNWPGKRDAKKLATKPPTGTLKPMPGEGVNEDATKNLIIEGDNLEVLRIMQKAYAGRIKMIYIDPPYNTGNDFVYKDDFKEPVESYLRKSGQADEEGLLVANPKASGRYHSNWLNMMYPRLRLARNLLRDDGVIFVSIDDNELFNLKSIMDQIFGDENYINTIAVKAKPAAGASGGGEDKRLKKNVEYVVVYVKNNDSERGFAKFNDVFEEHDLMELIEDMEDGGKSWKYTSILLNEGKFLEERVVYDGSGAPISVKKYKGIKRTTINKVQDESLDERSAYQKHFTDIFSDTNAQTSIRTRIIDEFVELENDELLTAEYTPRSGRDKGIRVKHFYISPSIRRVIWLKDTADQIDGNVVKKDRVGTLWSDFNWNNVSKEGDIPFPNGKKPISFIQRMIRLCTQRECNDIVLDFFAGSGSTGHSVVDQNLQDDGNRVFINVQLPEQNEEISFRNIAELTKQRLKNALSKLNDSEMTEIYQGFKSFRLEMSNFRRWTDFDGTDPQALGQLFESLETPFVDGWTPEGVLIEVMLTEGFPLDSDVSRAEAFTAEVQRVKHPELNLELLLCLEEKLDSSIVPLLTDLDHTVFVCRESALSDEIKLQLADVITVKTL